MTGTPRGGSERAITRPREMPLDPNIVARTDADLAACLGARPAKTSRQRRTRNLILGQLVLLAWGIAHEVIVLPHIIAHRPEIGMIVVVHQALFAVLQADRFDDIHT